MLRDEIQAYLDAHNIRENVVSDITGKRIEMADGLREVDGVFFYLYDGLSSTGIRPMDGNRVLVYYECCDPHEEMRPDQVVDTTLAEHFHELTKMLWEMRLGDAQHDYVESCGGWVTNGGWSVMHFDDRIEYCSKTDSGKICSTRVWSTGEVTHEWLD